MALFQFGRTLQCACGARVALAPRVRRVSGRAEPRFSADAMLGRLARWLRAMGYDTRYDAHVEDGELVRRALLEGRVVLTRDRRLPDEWTVPSALVLETGAPLEQLREVVSHFDLDWRRGTFTRCTRCNVPVEPLTRDAARGRVPPGVFARTERFARCPGCDRVYWDGSHTDRMRRVLERALSPRDPRPAPRAGAARRGSARGRGTP